MSSRCRAVHHAGDLVLLRQGEQDPDRDLPPKVPRPTLRPPQPQMGSESRARLPRAPRLLGVWDKQCFSKGIDFNREINYFLVVMCAGGAGVCSPEYGSYSIVWLRRLFRNGRETNLPMLGLASTRSYLRVLFYWADRKRGKQLDKTVWKQI